MAIKWIKLCPTTYWFCCCLTNLKISGVVGSLLTAIICIAGLVSCFSPACETIYDSDQQNVHQSLMFIRSIFIFVQAVLLISSIALVVIFIIDWKRFICVGEVFVFCSFFAYPFTAILFIFFYCKQLLNSMIVSGETLDVILFTFYIPMVIQFSLPVNSYCYLVWQEKQLNIQST